MVLQRVDTGDKIEAIYESSNIIASSFNKQNNDLTVTFKKGGSYTYSKVSNTDYMRFETADSQGKVLNSNIKSYAFSKNDNVDTEELLKKIKLLKEHEVIAARKDVISSMESVIAYFTQTGLLHENGLEDVSKRVDFYNSVK